jgi:hypothetical protein
MGNTPPGINTWPQKDSRHFSEPGQRYSRLELSGEGRDDEWSQPGVEIHANRQTTRGYLLEVMAETLFTPMKYRFRNKASIVDVSNPV